MDDWHRWLVFGCVLLVTLILARLVDRLMARRDLPPDVRTRYQVLRRTVLTLIIFVGVLSALLVIPLVVAAWLAIGLADIWVGFREREQTS